MHRKNTGRREQSVSTVTHGQKRERQANSSCRHHSFLHSFIPHLSFIHPSRYSFIHSSPHPFPICHPFIPQFTSTFALFPILSFIHPSHHAFVPPLIHSSQSRSSIPSIIHSPLQPSVHSHLHSSIPPVIHSSAVSQCLFCAEPQARCQAPLINKVDPVPTPKTGIQFPGRGGWSDFFLPPFSNNFQKRM